MATALPCEYCKEKAIKTSHDLGRGESLVSLPPCHASAARKNRFFKQFKGLCTQQALKTSHDLGRGESLVSLPSLPCECCKETTISYQRAVHGTLYTTSIKESHDLGRGESLVLLPPCHANAARKKQFLINKQFTGLCTHTLNT